MWKCKQCGEENEDTFDSCWNCGSSHDGTQSVEAKEFKSLKEEVTKADCHFHHFPTYYPLFKSLKEEVTKADYSKVDLYYDIRHGSHDSSVCIFCRLGRCRDQPPNLICLHSREHWIAQQIRFNGSISFLWGSYKRPAPRNGRSDDTSNGRYCR